MTRVAKPDWLAVLHDVGNDQNLGVSRQLELMQYVNLQRTEAPAERYLLVGRDSLITKHDNVMIQMRAMNALEYIGRKRFAQVETCHFSA